MAFHPELATPTARQGQPGMEAPATEAGEREDAAKGAGAEDKKAEEAEEAAAGKKDAAGEEDKEAEELGPRV
jgi:hypothetical protein